MTDTPNTLEALYVKHGYVLPEGFTWKLVHEARAKWETDERFMPVCRVPGQCVGWGIPYVNGKPLSQVFEIMERVSQ